MRDDLLRFITPNTPSTKWCARAMKWLGDTHPAFFDKVNEIAESATYSVRKYSNTFFCWAEIDGMSFDPYPASRFPKSVLCFEIALAIAD